MKLSAYLISAILLLAACNTDGSGISPSGDLATSMDSMSYTIGAFFGKQNKSIGLTTDAAQIAQGLQDAMTGESSINDTLAAQVMMRFQMDISARQGKPYSEDDPMPGSLDTLSYIMGRDFGMQMKDLEMDVNSSTFMQGVMDYSGEEEIGQLTKEEMEVQFQTFSTAAQAKQMAKSSVDLEKNIEIGRAFIDSIAQVEGVLSTPSGLHFEILREGSGDSPAATDLVKVDYEGSLINGKVFDSSYERGQPIEFALNQVIPGWTEGVQLMTPGSKFKFYIPYNLAYGDQGSPPNIGPGETLVFLVELHEVK